MGGTTRDGPASASLVKELKTMRKEMEALKKKVGDKNSTKGKKKALKKDKGKAKKNGSSKADKKVKKPTSTPKKKKTQTTGQDKGKEKAKACRHRGFVFKGQGVELSHEVEYRLSLGKRFLFNKFFFRNEENNEYDAAFKDYKWLPNPEAPKAHQTLEDALDVRWEAIKRLFAVSRTEPKPALCYTVGMESLRQYLRERKFLVKPTDKNLGLAIITSEWYRKQVLTHLQSDNFCEIDVTEATRIMQYYFLRIKDSELMMYNIEGMTEQK
ncbi:hypothetical protein EV426DRAFT_709977 [Tirmania nivea]|nr:hypothetical protein EV426DRAFT_709977 [Tirmania nivea]